MVTEEGERVIYWNFGEERYHIKTDHQITMIHFEDLTMHYSYMLKIYQDVVLHNFSAFFYRMPYWVSDVNTNNFGASLLLLLQKLHSVGLCSLVPIERVFQKLKTAKNHYIVTYHVLHILFNQHF
jgi:hypothetical protein